MTNDTFNKLQLAIMCVLAVLTTSAIIVYANTELDGRKSIMTTFDNAEKAHQYAKEVKQKALLALESATQNEANAYDVYKSARCSYAFDKLAHNEPVSDDTKDLCGIIKNDVDTKSEDNLSTVK